MFKSVWAGGTAVALLCAAAARADEPAKAKDGPQESGHRVIVQAVEGQPGGAIQVQVVPGKPKVVRQRKVIILQEDGKDKPAAPGRVIELREGNRGEGRVQVRAFPGQPLGAGAFGVLKPVKVSDYWIGLECRPVEAALGTQLKLAEGQGLVIHSVAPESPAAKAGLKQHDVIVKAGGKPVGGVDDLVEAVDAAKEKKLTLELIREARPKKVDVTPAKRPKRGLLGLGPRHIPLPAPGNPDFEALRKWHEQFKPGAGPPMRFHFFQEGAILPPGAPVHPPLPGNMSVAITRQGGEPAKIVVSKDGHKWEVTEKELDKLPKDVRPHVERMLGRIPSGGPGQFDIDVDILRPAPGFAPPPGVVPFHDKQFEKQLDRMHRQLEELRKAVEQMQGRAKGPEKPKNR